MTQNMLRFVDTGKETPKLREAAERRGDFEEIYRRFADASAVEQASRCSQCGVPFCQVNCPLGNHIPDWLMLTAAGRLQEAHELSQATNNFPEICGRICPQDRLCEGNCVIEKGFSSVTIGAVERYINDTAWEEGWIKAAAPAVKRDQSVGIIGGGPAGLTAAQQLRAQGYRVDLYDRYDRMGGLLIYGIPNFKLDKAVVDRRTRLIGDSGVRYHANVEIGGDLSFADLRARHDAVLIATGVYRARELRVPGAGLGGVYPALAYLIAANRKGLGDAVPDYDDGTLNAADRDVVVIGGGDTAMDCVRTAVRQGAKSVKCLYRRDRANMPGSMREVAYAEQEGVAFVWQTAPQAFLGGDRVETVRAIKTRLSVPDAQGRQTPQEIPGSEHDIAADLVINALGFDAEDLPILFDQPELGVSDWGTVEVDQRTMATNLAGVYAAGDIVRGASLVVWAIADGRAAADAIHADLQAKAETRGAA